MTTEALSTKAALLASATGAAAATTATQSVNSYLTGYHTWFAMWGPTVLGVISILSLLVAIIGKIIQHRQNNLIHRQNKLLEEQMGGTSKPAPKPKNKKRKGKKKK